MKSPFLGFSLSLSLGIIAQHYGFALMSGGPAILFFGVVLLWTFRKHRFFLPFLFALIMLTGAFRAHSAGIRPVNAVENFISPYRVELTGKVLNLPDVKRRGKRVIASFILEARTLRYGPKRYKKLKSITGKVQAFWIQPGFIPEKGDTLCVFARLEEPRRAMNPGEFDHAKYLDQKNVFAVFQPVGYRSGRLIRKAPPWDPGWWIGRVRSSLAGLIDRLYPDPRSAVLKALVLGVRSDVGAEVQNAFMKTGTVHLLAISGLNITMIAGSFFLVFLFLGLPRKLTAALTVLIVAAYVPLAGSGIPVQRAGIMAFVVLGAVLLDRTAHLLNALCVSFFLILWLDPKSLWNVGFQLSFLSVLSLIAVLPVLPRHRLLSLSVGGSLAVLIGTSPVVLYYFNTFSPVGVVANLAAIPLFDAALLTTLFAMMFFWVPLLGQLLVAVSSELVTAGLTWINWLAAWRSGYWFLVRPEAWQLWAYYVSLGLFLWLSRRTIPYKRILLGLCALFWAVAALSMFRINDPHCFRMTVLSSGKEPILHVRFSKGVDWLVNAGRDFPSDQGERLVLPYFRYLGIKEIDGILFTDLYRKHCGGLEAVLRDISVRKILFPASERMSPFLYRTFKRQGDVLKTGTREEVGGEGFNILESDRRGTVLLVEAASARILFISALSFLAAPAVEGADPDILILPFLKEPLPEDVRQVLLKRQCFLVAAGGESGAFRGLSQAGIRYFDLTETGALTIRGGRGGFLFDHFL